MIANLYSVAFEQLNYWSMISSFMRRDLRSCAHFIKEMRSNKGGPRSVVPLGYFWLPSANAIDQGSRTSLEHGARFRGFVTSTDGFKRGELEIRSPDSSYMNLRFSPRFFSPLPRVGDEVEGAVSILPTFLRAEDLRSAAFSGLPDNLYHPGIQ